MSGGRDVDVDVALAARGVARAARAAARRARAEAEREERALLLLQGEELLRAHRRVRRRLLQRVRRRGAHERLGRRGLGRGGGRVVVVVGVGEGHAPGNRLPILWKTKHTLLLRYILVNAHRSRTVRSERIEVKHSRRNRRFGQCG